MKILLISLTTIVTGAFIFMAVVTSYNLYKMQDGSYVVKCSEMGKGLPPESHILVYANCLGTYEDNFNLGNIFKYTVFGGLSLFTGLFLTAMASKSKV